MTPREEAATAGWSRWGRATGQVKWTRPEAIDAVAWTEDGLTWFARDSRGIPRFTGDDAEDRAVAVALTAAGIQPSPEARFQRPNDEWARLRWYRRRNLTPPVRMNEDE